MISGNNIFQTELIY